MEPFTMLFLLLLGAAAAATVVSVLTWSAVEDWIQAHKVDSGFAQIVRNRMANGNFRVVTGVFDSTGDLKSSEAWEAIELDTELQGRFSMEGNVIRVTT